MKVHFMTERVPEKPGEPRICLAEHDLKLRMMLFNCFLLTRVRRPNPEMFLLSTLIKLIDLSGTVWTAGH